MLVKLLLIIALIGVLVFLFLLIYIYTRAFVDTKKNSDVIIVLGALTNSPKSSMQNFCLTARVNHGIALLNQGFAKKILFSGGKTKQDSVTESVMMDTLALEQHVNPNQILLERQSQSTYENLLFGKQLMENNNLKTAIIVTDPFHTPRATLVAKKLGIHFSVSPALDSPCSKDFPKNLKLLFTEVNALIRYKFAGKI